MPKNSPTTATKRPGGRPRKRSDRWYALLALAYCVARQRVENAPSRRRRGPPSPTIRGLVSDASSLSPKTVTNAITTARREGLFKRDLTRHVPHSRTATTGRLTPKGVKALGEVPRAWRKSAGRDWLSRVPDERTLEALVVLGQELREEAARTARSSTARATAGQQARNRSRQQR